jgi:hypothetical protein
MKAGKYVKERLDIGSWHLWLEINWSNLIALKT